MKGSYAAFIANVNLFVAQAADTGHLSIFMTALNGSDEQVIKRRRWGK